MSAPVSRPKRRARKGLYALWGLCALTLTLGIPGLTIKQAYDGADPLAAFPFQTPQTLHYSKKGMEGELSNGTGNYAVATNLDSKNGFSLSSARHFFFAENDTLFISNADSLYIESRHNSNHTGLSVLRDVTCTTEASDCTELTSIVFLDSQLYGAKTPLSAARAERMKTFITQGRAMAAGMIATAQSAFDKDAALYKALTPAQHEAIVDEYFKKSAQTLALPVLEEKGTGIFADPSADDVWHYVSLWQPGVELGLRADSSFEQMQATPNMLTSWIGTPSGTLRLIQTARYDQQLLYSLVHDLDPETNQVKAQLLTYSTLPEVADLRMVHGPAIVKSRFTPRALTKMFETLMQNVDAVESMRMLPVPTVPANPIEMHEDKGTLGFKALG